MKVVIPGGSGQIGTVLARAFTADGHEVVVLSRKARQAAWQIVEWDGASLGRSRSGFVSPLAVKRLSCG